MREKRISIRKMPEVGQMWQLKSDQSKQARVIGTSDSGVVITMTWSKKGHSVKSMDAFLKQYSPNI